MRLRGFVLLLFAVMSLEAQIRFPGQSPYPGGNPYPGGGNSGSRGSGRTNDTSRSKRKEAPATVTTTGMLRLVAGSQFVVEADDHRIITYQTSDRCKVEKDGKTIDLKDLAIADHVTVDAFSDDDGFFTATAVTFNLAGSAADREAAARTWDLPTLKSRSASSASGAVRDSERGDDDRPILRRTPDPHTPSPNSSDASNSTAPPAASEASQSSSGDIADNRPTTEVRPPDPARDADDPGAPQLRRGRPVSHPRAIAQDSESSGVPSPPTASSAGATASRPAATAAVPADDRADGAPGGIVKFEPDPTIAKAKDAAREYAGTLPDFFCRQLTTRYEMEHPKEGWQSLDIVTADVAYQEGHESYTNIKIGNKAVNTSMDDIPGTRSSGEFASILEDLFSPATAAAFRKTGQDTIRGRSAYTYSFEVKRENSHWRIISAAQLYYPAYRGTVWIDRETSRVLRIEMESRNIPILFPFDKTETATDYDFVRLSTPQEFLMPVDAEVLSCEQGSSRCLRNRIEFRNYRKFGAESDITFN